MKKLLVLLLGIIIIASPIWSKERGAILFYNSPFAFVDNKTVLMPAPVTVVNGQAMIPLDFMANLTGSKVSYENGYIWVYHNQRDKPKAYFNKEAKQPLLDLINHAQKSIWVQMYSFTYEPVIEALLNARQRTPPVEIYCLFDNTKGNVEHAEDLAKAGVQIKYDWRGGVQFHRKLAVFDESDVWIGSTNWSENGFEKNSEVDLNLDDPELADEILEQMQSDWQKAIVVTPEEPKPTPPGTEYPYIGNKSSKVYHKSSCSSVASMSPENKDPLKTRQEAESKGYHPCGRCKPDKS